MDDDIILGGICELANQCKVWFSPMFDIQGVIAEIRRRRSAST
jgi:hypothetical protein